MSVQEAIDQLNKYMQPAYSNNCTCCQEWRRRIQEILALLEQAQPEPENVFDKRYTEEAHRQNMATLHAMVEAAERGQVSQPEYDKQVNFYHPIRCAKCGKTGSSFVQTGWPTFTCEDCFEKPPEPGDFTKDVRGIVEAEGGDTQSLIRIAPEIVLEACHLIDAKNKEIAELKDAVDSGCHLHTSESKVDAEGCCSICGEDLNYLAKQALEIDRLTAENKAQAERIKGLQDCLWALFAEIDEFCEVIDEPEKKTLKEWRKSIEQALKGEKP